MLGLLVAGASNRGIAAALDISPHTAVRHVNHILVKLRVASRGQAVAQALGLALLGAGMTEHLTHPAGADGVSGAGENE